jgi:hypothetical protein
VKIRDTEGALPPRLPPRFVPDSPEMLPSSSFGLQPTHLSLDTPVSPASKGSELVKDGARMLKAPERPGPKRQIVPELVQAGPQGPSQRVMPRSLMNSIVHTQHLPQDPQLRTPVIEALVKELATHTFNFDGMPPKDMVNLFLALHKTRELQSDGLLESLGRAICESVLKLELEPETLVLLGQESPKLPRDAMQEIRAALETAMPKLLARLADDVVKGVLAKSVSAIPLTLEAAMMVHAAVNQVSLPLHTAHAARLQNSFESLLTAAFARRDADFALLGAVFAGVGMTEEGAFNARKQIPQENSVSLALKRHTDGINDPEAQHAKLALRAYARAKRPDWSEPPVTTVVTGTSRKPTTTSTTETLFGDRSVRPSEALVVMKSERGIKINPDYLKFLTTLHDINGMTSLTLVEAQRLMAPLRAIADNPEYVQARQKHGGLSEPLRGWSLADLQNEKPNTLPNALYKKLTDARVEIERRVVVDVNDQLASRAKRKKDEDAARARLDAREVVPIQMFQAVNTGTSTGAEVSIIGRQDVQKLLVTVQVDAVKVLFNLPPPGSQPTTKEADQRLAEITTRIRSLPDYGEMLTPQERDSLEKQSDDAKKGIVKNKEDYHPVRTEETMRRGVELAAQMSVLHAAVKQIRDSQQCSATLEALTALSKPTDRPRILQDQQTYEVTISALKVRLPQLKTAEAERAKLEAQE